VVPTRLVGAPAARTQRERYGLAHATLDDLVTALSVFIDDLLAARPRRLGRPPRISDAELVCLAVAQVPLDCAGERRWLRLVRHRLAHLFRYVPQQAGHNRRVSTE
jgi:hypothetical protein